MVYWQKDESLERYVMYPGDLVMSLTGTVGKDDYGNVCILDDDYEMYYLNQRNAKLEIKEGIDKYYLSQLLKFEQIKKRLTGISRGVRQANISNKDILNLVVPIPPLELQNQFADFVKHVDKSKLQYHPHTHLVNPIPVNIRLFHAKFIERTLLTPKMTVYHGGYMPVKEPEIRIGRNTKDFGPGFYCTVIREQAIRWARRYDTKNCLGI